MEISQEWLAFEKDVLGKRPLTTGTVEEVRQAYRTISETLEGQYAALGEEWGVRDHKEVTSSGLAIRIYTPTGDPKRGEYPVGVFAHGGGHVVGGAWKSSFEDRMCRYIAHNAQVVIAQVDFRLGPEYPAPAQVEDCVEAYKWGNPEKYFSIGSSLGGGAAVAVTLKLLDENLGDSVKGIVALAPALLHPWNVPEEYKGIFKAYEEAWKGAPMQDGESMVVFYGK
ncbi:MAG: hypothetical protein Q9176_007940 [Flavoplaca citrina]